MSAGYRSFAFRHLGGAGAGKPPAGVRSLLAYWLGGACGYAFVPVPPIIPVPVPVPVPTPVRVEGLPFGKRPFIDDDEVQEFLRLWVIWNDVE